MKNLILTFLAVAICAATLPAQAPQAFNYQAVIRDANGNLLENQAVGIKISLLQGSATGTEVYTETHATTTNTFGQVDLKIGTGTVQSGQFNNIQWSTGIYYLKLAVDITGGTNYLVMGTTQMLSVPYALYAQNSSNSLWQANGTSLYYNVGNVGIGTESPSSLFDIRQGTSRFQYDGSVENVSYLRLGSTAINDKVSAKIQFAGWGIMHGGLSFVPRNLSNNKGAFIFSMGTADDPENQSPYLTVQQGGNIGIGTTNPSYLLHVAKNQSGGAYIAYFIKSDSGPGYLGLKGGNGGGRSYFEFDSDQFGIYTSNNTQTSWRHLTIDASTGILEFNGRTKTQVLEITGGSDLAEPFPIVETLPEGSVVVIDENNPGNLIQSSQPYDKRVAGIVSGAGGVQPGLTLQQEGLMEGTQNIALSGRVYVKATSENGAIIPGDLLTTSSVPGHAMKATDHEKSFGTVIGKAMSGLEQGEGLVLVLVNLQ